MYVGTVFASMNTRDDSRQWGNAANDHRQENIKIAKWMINAIKRRIQNLAQEGVIVVPGWEPITAYEESRAMPSISERDFQLTFPSANGTLALRADVLTEMAEKFSNEDVRKEWDMVVEQHNQAFNQSGKAYEGETMMAVDDKNDGGAHQAKRKLSSISEDLESLKKKQKCCVIPQNAGGNLIIGANGMVWFQAGQEKDAVLSSQGPPLCLVYGAFKIAEEAQKAMEDSKNASFKVGFEDDGVKAFIRKSDDESSGKTLISLSIPPVTGAGEQGHHPAGHCVPLCGARQPGGFSR